jgi:hypothetical protein
MDSGNRFQVKRIVVKPGAEHTVARSAPLGKYWRFVLPLRSLRR